MACSRWNNHGRPGAVCLENWVEERACAEKGYHISGANKPSARELNRTGHKDILVFEEKKFIGRTTASSDYLPHGRTSTEQGARRRSREAELFRHACNLAKESEKEREELVLPSLSLHQQDYVNHMGSSPIAPDKERCLAEGVDVESTASFWYEARDSGIPRTKRAGGDPFKRNAAFSKPISEYTVAPVKDE